MHSIDLKTILQSTVSGGYRDLVTRHTGRAVRGGIEQALSGVKSGQVTVIDFGAVGCMDISCADEIVGQLLLTNGRGHYYVLQGVTEAHCEAISLVLERHELAVVAQDRDGRCQLLGSLEDTARRAFGAVMETGQAGATEVAERLALPADAARRVLEELLARRLVRQEADSYRTLTAR